MDAERAAKTLLGIAGCESTRVQPPKQFVAEC